jgi:membrane-bound lytic murein transglycosylase D
MKIILALSLGVLGIIGCAGNQQSYELTATSTVQLPSLRPLSEKLSPDSFSQTSAIPEQAQENILTVEAPQAPARNLLSPESEAQSWLLEPSEATVEHSNQREKPAATAAKAPSPAVRTQPSLQADNRLLELLEKEIDRAVEQPTEHRRLQFSKEVVNHPKVRHFIREYSIAGKKSFEELLGRSGKYMPMIEKVLAREGLPKELGYLALLESQFILDSTSRNGAVGLWQFVPATARQYGLRIDSWVDERRDPVKSTRAAAAYLKDLHDYYGRWFLATAAYNAGPGNVDKALRQSQAKDFWSIKAKAQLSEETRNFVPKFIAIALIASYPLKYGLQDIRY